MEKKVYKYKNRISCALCNNYRERSKYCSQKSVYFPMQYSYSSWKNCQHFSLNDAYMTSENISKVQKHWDAGYDINFQKHNNTLFSPSKIKQRMKTTKSHGINWFVPGKQFTKSVVDYVKKHILNDFEYIDIELKHPKGFDIIYDFIKEHLCDGFFIDEHIECAIIACFDVIGIDIVQTKFLENISNAARFTRNSDYRNGELILNYNPQKVTDMCIAVTYNALKEKNLTQRFFDSPTETKGEKRITRLDFIVRTNVFKCYHSEHKLKDMVGILKIKKDCGDIINQEVRVAYCEKCNCYFIHKDEFDEINTIGTPICEILETESYYKKGLYCSDAYLKYAKRSILMKHGYNVRAGNGLTYIDRQNILADLVDNQIASVFSIECLIKSFISQKKHLYQYEEAVEKWETDVQFIKNYNSDKKERVYVNSIKIHKYKNRI